MKRPSFEYPICGHCGALVEKFSVELLPDGNYRVVAFCHERQARLLLETSDIETHGGNPLVHLHPFGK